jgi:hypothetical protein
MIPGMNITFSRIQLSIASSSPYGDIDLRFEIIIRDDDEKMILTGG